MFHAVNYESRGEIRVSFFSASILVQVGLLRLRWRIAPYPVIQLQDQDVISHETKIHSFFHT